MSNKELTFRKIAVAIAFSPRCEAMIAEAKLLQETFHSQLIFVHVGKKSLQEEQYLKHLLHRFKFDETSTSIIWEEGEPVETILKVCQNHKIDLLVAGALEKEGIIKYVFGGISRQLSRKAKCSMLMLIEPKIHPTGFKHLVVEGTDHPKTEYTIAKAVEIARAFGSKQIDIIQESDESKLALIRSEEFKEKEADDHKEALHKEEDEKLEEILRCTDCGELVMNTERIEGKPGYVISKFSKEKEADLLVLNSPDKSMNLFDRVFPHDIEYALSDLPCNLLIVHSKDSE